MSKEMGISHERAAQVLGWGYDLRVSRSALCRAMARLSKKAEPSYEELQRAARHSFVNHLDETGWRVAAHLEWLWVCVSADVTVYAILDRKSTRLNSSHVAISYAVFCLKK